MLLLLRNCAIFRKQSTVHGIHWVSNKLRVNVGLSESILYHRLATNGSTINRNRIYLSVMFDESGFQICIIESLEKSSYEIVMV